MAGRRRPKACRGIRDFLLPNRANRDEQYQGERVPHAVHLRDVQTRRAEFHGDAVTGPQNGGSSR